MLKISETKVNDRETLVIYGVNGELVWEVVDHSNLINRKKYFATETMENPNYVRELKRAEKAKGKNKDKEIIFDTTETIPSFNFNHSSKKFVREFNKLLAEDEKCYEELKQGIISYAQEEIEEVQHHIDSLENEEDKIDFMAAIQRKKRHAKNLSLLVDESENRKTERMKGNDNMRSYRLSYISQSYITLLYSWGYSAESIEAFMGLKNGYINHITKYINQRVKREMILEFETTLAWVSIEKFKQLPLSTGKNLTDAQINEIKEVYKELQSIKAVVDKLGYSDKTVRKWVTELLAEEPNLAA